MQAASSSIAINQFLISNNQVLRNINLFWAGFIIYTLSFTISQTTVVNYIFCEILQLIGLLFLVPKALSIMTFKLESPYLKAIFLIFCCWLLTILLRGFNFNSDFVKQMLFDAGYGGFIYFVPLTLLFPKNLSFYKKIFTVIVILDIFYIIYDII